MTRHPHRSTLTYTLFPYTTLVRSEAVMKRLQERLRIIGIEPAAETQRGYGRVGEFQPGRQIAIELGERARSEEHTSELQSLMRISYAVFCLKKKSINRHHNKNSSTPIPIHSISSMSVIKRAE